MRIRDKASWELKTLDAHFYQTKQCESALYREETFANKLRSPEKVENCLRKET